MVSTIERDDYLSLLGVTAWTSRNPDSVGNGIYYKEIFSFGDELNDSLVCVLLGQDQKKHLNISINILSSLFYNRLCKVFLVSDDIHDYSFDELYCKYSNFILLKSYECNIVKDNEIEIDFKKISQNTYYKKQVMLNVFRLSDYTSRG